MCLQLKQNQTQECRSTKGVFPPRWPLHRRDLYGVTGALETPARVRLRWYTVIGFGQYHFVPLQHLLITSAPGCPGRSTLAPSWTKCQRQKYWEEYLEDMKKGFHVLRSNPSCYQQKGKNSRRAAQLSVCPATNLQFCRKLTRNPFAGTGLSPNPLGNPSGFWLDLIRS